MPHGRSHHPTPPQCGACVPSAGARERLHPLCVLSRRLVLAFALHDAYTPFSHSSTDRPRYRSLTARRKGGRKGKALELLLLALPLARRRRAPLAEERELRAQALDERGPFVEARVREVSAGRVLESVVRVHALDRPLGLRARGEGREHAVAGAEHALPRHQRGGGGDEELSVRDER